MLVLFWCHWALDGDSFHEFMKYFYTQPEKGQSAGKSLNLARKSMRESGNFRKMKTSFEKLHVIRYRPCVNNIHEDVKRSCKHSCICSGYAIDVYSYAPYLLRLSCIRKLLNLLTISFRVTLFVQF